MIWTCRCKEPIVDCEHEYNCNSCGGVIPEKVRCPIVKEKCWKEGCYFWTYMSDGSDFGHSFEGCYMSAIFSVIWDIRHKVEKR